MNKKTMMQKEFSFNSVTDEIEQTGKQILEPCAIHAAGAEMPGGYGIKTIDINPKRKESLLKKLRKTFG